MSTIINLSCPLFDSKEFIVNQDDEWHNINEGIDINIYELDGKWSAVVYPVVGGLTKTTCPICVCKIESAEPVNVLVNRDALRDLMQETFKLGALYHQEMANQYHKNEWCLDLMHHNGAALNELLAEYVANIKLFEQ